MVVRLNGVFALEDRLGCGLKMSDLWNYIKVILVTVSNSAG